MSKNNIYDNNYIFNVGGVEMIEHDEFEIRVLAFIDILGFKRMVKKAETDADEFSKLKKVLNYIDSLREENITGTMPLKELGRELTVFSDSIVISYPVNKHPSSVFYLLIDIIHIQLELMFEGVLLRGGISVGQLCHDDNIVFGEAMIDAHYLESKCANYPRIILTDKVIDVGVENRVYQHSKEEEFEYINSLIKRDFDGFYFIDFLSQWQELDSPDIYLKGLSRVKEVIENNILGTSDQNILSKYQWLKSYYTNVVNSLNPKYREGLLFE